MYSIKHMLDQCCADVEDSGPTLNQYSTNFRPGRCLSGNCAMSGDPVDASGQYINIFERCIIIQNHIHDICIHLAYFLFICLVILNRT